MNPGLGVQGLDRATSRLGGVHRISLQKQPNRLVQRFGMRGALVKVASACKYPLADRPDSQIIAKANSRQALPEFIIRFQCEGWACKGNT